MKNLISQLGIGPMSSEIIEAVFRCSQQELKPLMLIASKNQIDWDRGYVNTWNTEEYMVYIRQLREKYPQAKVYICRDHCGPGFKNNDLADVYQTIDSDITNGFDLIHVDFCHWPGNHSQILVESKKAIEYIHKKNSEMMIEIGTDENTGQLSKDISDIEADMDFFSQFKNIVFFVCQTGSLIKEINQAGSFNLDYVKQIKALAGKYNLNIKEHNADYLDDSAIRLRRGIVDAMNIAPQYGVLQTIITLERAFVYGVDVSEWLKLVYQSGRWGKWLLNNNKDNRLLCSVIAGHYNFSTPQYDKIYRQISQHEDLREIIISSAAKNFTLYLNNL
ncbi:MAG: hypothetical protein C3F02_00270 [Parcubacteria group bacterium]|nr:MAG: hypothetical protein C3F02_00270 [Parcubacteria group bacterium]